MPSTARILCVLRSTSISSQQIFPKLRTHSQSLSSVASLSSSSSPVNHISCPSAVRCPPLLTITTTRRPAKINARGFHSTTYNKHTALERLKKGEGYEVTYVTAEGEKITVNAKDDWNLLDIAHTYDIELEGACEGSLACSTCHVVMEQKYYDKLEEPSDEENDMLDLAFGLTETSRLGCQVKMCKELDGMTVRIPSATRNVKHKA
ncbi:2Fe-2S ferredoxin-type domain-containing protein [Chytridium lagenaria]|nr:2Fe-2S ferredoxin-type domain-containing protein [Chytridium lagenaria]